MEVKIKKLFKDAVIPKKAHSDDAGFDLVAVVGGWVESEQLYVYHTGLAFGIPKGYVGLLFPRSSVSKKDLIVANCVGVIDSGYTGEVTMKFTKSGRDVIDPIYKNGDRIGQLIIIPYPEIEFMEVDELEESER